MAAVSQDMWALFADASVKKEITLVEQVDDSRNHRGLPLRCKHLRIICSMKGI